MSASVDLESLKKAARVLRHTDVSLKNLVLRNLKDKIQKNQDAILKENQKDLDALSADATPAFKDRLLLNSQRLNGICESLEQVAKLPDPIFEVVETKTLKNNLVFNKVRSPLGVVFLIFESRPNVAIEAFSLAFKAGNAILLRGGKESQHTVALFYQYIRESLSEAGISKDCCVGLTNPDRELLKKLLQEKRYIDVVVPRGSERLIDFVSENSQIPVIKNDRGLCHIYVDESADLLMALEIIDNAKTQRPGVCNAAETLIVHQSIASKLLPQVLNKLGTVTFYADPKSLSLLKSNRTHAATDENFNTEYLDLKMNVKVVDTFDQALEHIERFGSKHSEAIVTENSKNARRFQSEVDAAAVYWNASTRFTDGFEMGLGGELGISTQKLHVRGPVGLRELTSLRWIIDGKGQVRK